jgi:hypothetical protein
MKSSSTWERPLAARRPGQRRFAHAGMDPLKLRDSGRSPIVTVTPLTFTYIDHYMRDSGLMKKRKKLELQPRLRHPQICYSFRPLCALQEGKILNSLRLIQSKRYQHYLLSELT